MFGLTRIWDRNITTSVAVQLYYGGVITICGFDWKNTKLKLMAVKHGVPVDLNHQNSKGTLI